MRIRIIILILAAIFLFPGSSPWEGAAAVAPAGELPATGFFVATNSFPLNTVVDITNIETGKSTRVIVAKTLNSPGLLAVVSREAADLIDMRAGSVSRIRMLQPSDPMAYMRFMENASVGAPLYDSANVITDENLEAKLLDELYKGDSYSPPAAAQVPPPSAPVIPEELAQRGYVVDEPEWGGSGRLNIVDVPGYNIEPVQTFEEPNHVTQITEQAPVEPVYVYEEKSEPEYIAEEEPQNEESWYIVESPEEEYVYTAEPEAEEEPEYIAEYKPEPVAEKTPAAADPYQNGNSKEIIKDVSQRYDERKSNEIIKDVPHYVSETDKQEINKDVPVYYTADGSRGEIVKDVPQWKEPPAEAPRQTLVPVEAEERLPPSTVYDIPLSDIIEGITKAPETVAPPPPVVTPPPSSDNFSVRTISQLDSGRYYVQLAAMSSDMVEGVVRKIDRRYDPVIFRDRDNIYRVLIGPLNQGESAAVLQRFKSIGYTDAFVRRGS